MQKKKKKWDKTVIKTNYREKVIKSYTKEN